MNSMKPTRLLFGDRFVLAVVVALLALAPAVAPVGAGGDAGRPPLAAAFQDDDDEDDGFDDDDDDAFVPVAPPPADPGPAPVAPVAPPSSEGGAAAVPVVNQPEVVYATLGGIVDDDGDPTTDGYRGGQVIARLAPGTDLAAFAARHSARELASIASRNVYLLQIPAGIAEDDFAAALETADDAVVWAEPNGVGQAPEGRPTNFFLSAETGAESPAEAYHAELFDLAGIAGCATGAGTVVAVIDTGIDATHPDLEGRVLPGGFNVLDNSGNTDDVGNGLDDDADGEIDEMVGHGTHVAGIIAQVAPDADILPITALDSDGAGDAFLLAEAIFYAVDVGVNVINLSLGSTRDQRVVADSVAEAAESGVMVAAAAGNLDRDQPVEYPAADPNAIGIAATDEDDAKSDFSNFGELVDLAAPGTDITSAYPGDDYASWSGTSMATPFVAGAAALLLAADPEMSVDAIMDRLMETAVSLEDSAPDHVGELGAGRLDIGAAVGCG